MAAPIQASPHAKRKGESSMTDLEARARAFATEAHARIGQVRKYTGEAYINHPAAVVELVRSVPHTEEMLAAAWLHDTMEDTGAKLGDLADLFGDAVAGLVEMLTDVSKPQDGNRVVRKAMDLIHTAKATSRAKTIKLADLIDNSKSILERDPGFARVYIREKAALLEVLREGDPTLWARAHGIVTVALRAQ
jgi:guanosine-3',5'-bis(diphosphate) 3'-pyrophosphohydrolase